MVAIDFTRKIVLICGSSYAGEMKKSVFTTLNFYLPAQNVVPMHCSANVSHEGESALFFGLSGTGKTTLSADPKRILIGDDEHGWGPDGIFNFEGGCYAKCIKLSQEAEPMIWDATNRFGAVLENVVFDPVSRVPDYDDGSKTENTRSAYPMEFIPNASRSGRAGHPKNIIFLTADAYGVMPPIAKLTPTQAMYHFLPATPPRSRAPKKGWSASSRNSPPASARRSCRAIRRSMPTCCATTSTGTRSTSGWSIPAGPAANTAKAAACRSRRRARC